MNSFLALYDLPSGTVFYDPDRAVPDDPRPRLAPGTPELDLAPYVNPSRGFEVQVPLGWMRVETPYGLVMVNGVPWDSEASLQVSAHRFDTIEEYLGRYGRGHLRDSLLVVDEMGTLDGRPRARFAELETPQGEPRRAHLRRVRRRTGARRHRRVSDRPRPRLPPLVRRRARLESRSAASAGDESDRSYSR